MAKIIYPNFLFQLTCLCLETEHINYQIKIKKLLCNKKINPSVNMEFVLQGSHIVDLVLNYGISNTAVLEIL